MIPYTPYTPYTSPTPYTPYTPYLNLIDSSLKQSLHFESAKKSIPILKAESQKLNQNIYQTSDFVKEFSAVQISGLINFIGEINQSYIEIIQRKCSANTGYYSLT